MSLIAGSRLGPYEIHGPIGAGGMGEVYRARDTRLGRVVAIKVLSPALTSDPSARQRFEREARAVAALSHPQICAVFDIGHQDGTDYLVMEYVEGETLAARLRLGKLPVVEALQHGIHVAQALAAAHRAAIIHRDVKPANIMITKAGAKLLDFGLAKPRSSDETIAATAIQAEELTQAGMILGTVQYMAPEQLEGREADARTDLFGLGGVLYEMFSGRRAFEATSHAAVIGRILHSPPEDPLDGDSPQAVSLNRVVCRCLEKDPDDRFQSAQDLSFVLEASAKPLNSKTGHLPVGSSRIPPWLLALGVLVLVTAAWLLIASPLSSDREPLSFQQVTWRHGSVLSGRFAPDGQSVIYGAAWDGAPRELFIHHPGSRESRSLNILAAEALSVSRTGELAIGQRLRYSGSLVPVTSTLARMPLSGGAPREILEGVAFADWSPDARNLAVARRTPEGMVLEFPIGKPLYETTGWIGYPKVSRDGKLLAFVHFPERQRSGRITIVTLDGKVSELTEELFRPRGLAWSPNGDEVWFTFQDTEGGSPLHAVTTAGKARVIERLPGWAVLQDITADGSVLVTKERIRVRAFASTPELGSEREISWLDGTNVSDISRDRRHVLFTEAAAGGGQGFSAYIRGVDSSPPVRLADGWALALSPLENVAVIYSILKERLIAVPTGAGESRELPRGPITSYTTGAQNAGWLPDGRLVFDARADQGLARLFIQDLQGGDPQPTKVETSNSGWAISPDGLQVAVDTTAGPEIRTLATGDSMPLRSVRKEDRVAAWNRDGIFVVAKSDFTSSVIDRIDPNTGKRTPWRTLINPERVGIEQPFADSPIIIDSDTYSFGFLQVLSELVVVRGLR